MTEMKKELTKAVEKKVKKEFMAAINGKKEQFEKFTNRIFYLTSDCRFDGTVTFSAEGTYFELTGTRAKFTAFVDNTGAIKRKPKKITSTITFEIEGNDKDITRVR